MFRLAKNSDFNTLAQIYRQSVKELAPLLYTKEQVEAWSNFPNNKAKFREFIFKPKTYLVETEQTIISFSGLDFDGHIASLYVNPFFARQGYGTQILLYVLEKGRQLGLKKFYTEASFFSQPLFEKCGFSIIEMETAKYGEIIFERYKMEKIVDN
jgi:putative acetyltransferase